MLKFGREFEIVAFNVEMMPAIWSPGDVEFTIFFIVAFGLAIEALKAFWITVTA